MITKLFYAENVKFDDCYSFMLLFSLQGNETSLPMEMCSNCKYLNTFCPLCYYANGFFCSHST